jgi:transketolase
MNPSSLRKAIAEMISRSGEGHIPSAFSIVDILISLYSTVPSLGLPNSDNKFVLSKGHGCAALYVVLASKGILSWIDIENYGKNGSKLGGHPDRSKQSGVEANSGSLGHGFPFAVGLSLGDKLQGLHNKKTYVLLGDGECQEGTTWEAASIATNQNLTNLVAVIDWNGSASQLQPKEYLEEKWNAFGWKTIQVDGHDLTELNSLFATLQLGQAEKPVVVIARTTKGKGVSFIEGHGPWHHRIPNAQELDLIIRELDR